MSTIKQPNPIRIHRKTTLTWVGEVRTKIRISGCWQERNKARRVIYHYVRHITASNDPDYFVTLEVTITRIGGTPVQNDQKRILDKLKPLAGTRLSIGTGMIEEIESKESPSGGMIIVFRIACDSSQTTSCLQTMESAEMILKYLQCPPTHIAKLLNRCTVKEETFVRCGDKWFGLWGYLTSEQISRRAH